MAYIEMICRSMRCRVEKQMTDVVRGLAGKWALRGNTLNLRLSWYDTVGCRAKCGGRRSVIKFMLGTV